MRTTIITAGLMALILSAGAALAQAMPGGVKVTNGSLTDSAGKALYTYDNDTMRGMSHCMGGCAREWPPFTASDKDTPSGDWTIISREDGKRQWVYKNKPLYYYYKDKAGQPPAGAAIEHWKQAK